MQSVIDIFNFIAANYQAILAGIMAVLTGLIAIFMIIPGEQPEKALQSALDFITKFSSKPKDKP